MPPLPAVPRTARIRVYQHIATHEVQNIFHATWSTGSVNGTDMLTIAGVFDEVFGADAVGSTFWSSDWHYDQTTCEDISSPTGAFGIVNLHAGAGGASQQSHSQSAVVASWPINARYRGGHPRTYFAGISDDNNVDGRTWNSGAVTHVKTLCDDLRAAVNALTMSGGGALNLSVVHYQGPVDLGPYPRTDYLAAAIVKTQMGSQRRRVRSSPEGVL